MKKILSYLIIYSTASILVWGASGGGAKELAISFLAVAILIAWALGLAIVGSREMRHGPLAQRSEQRTHNPLAVGSNPTRPTMC